jgi:REP element-mobilizing transposase RayT
MARCARRPSESGIYHVMLRGIDQGQLFYDDDDRYAFLNRLEKAKDAYGCRLYAYCLMGNHVHLLIHEGSLGLSLAIKGIATSYARYFNARYDRSGYLFSGRFKSEPVDTDEYLLELLRYIHNNPLKAGDTERTWSSYEEYATKARIIDSQMILAMFDDNPDRAQTLLLEFLAEPVNADLIALQDGALRRVKDADAIEMIKSAAGTDTPLGIQNMEKGERDLTLAALRREGVSIRQLSRLTGISKGVIQQIRLDE